MHAASTDAPESQGENATRRNYTFTMEIELYKCVQRGDHKGAFTAATKRES